MRAVLAALARAGEARPDLALRQAESGEFTRRAFENGRIDLNEAEGLADLLSAETESQRRAALLMAEGHFSRRLDAWRLELLRLSALAESLLDFSDEDDVAGDDAMLNDCGMAFAWCWRGHPTRASQHSLMRLWGMKRRSSLTSRERRGTGLKCQ